MDAHIHPVSATYRKWKKAVKEAQQAEEDFQSICDAVGPTDTSAWTALEKHLQKERSKDIKVMDQFDTADKQGPSQTITIRSVFNKFSRAWVVCRDNCLD